MRNIVASLMLACATGAAAQDLQLPAPDMEQKSVSVVEALKTRHSVRDYTDQQLSLQEISNLCWAACGQTRDDQHITAPTAMNRQEVLLFVFTKDGVYEYITKENMLKLRAVGDHRDIVADRQTMVQNAPAMLVMVVDYDKFGRKDEHSIVMTSVDVGNVSENVNLYCQSVGLATVPRGTMNSEAISKLLGLTENQVPVLNNPVGYEAK